MLGIDTSVVNARLMHTCQRFHRSLHQPENLVGRELSAVFSEICRSGKSLGKFNGCVNRVVLRNAAEDLYHALHTLKRSQHLCVLFDTCQGFCVKLFLAFKRNNIQPVNIVTFSFGNIRRIELL